MAIRLSAFASAAGDTTGNIRSRIIDDEPWATSPKSSQKSRGLYEPVHLLGWSAARMFTGMGVHWSVAAEALRSTKSGERFIEQAAHDVTDPLHVAAIFIRKASLSMGGRHVIDLQFEAGTASEIAAAVVAANSAGDGVTAVRIGVDGFASVNLMNAFARARAVAKSAGFDLTLETLAASGDRAEAEITSFSEEITRAD